MSSRLTDHYVNHRKHDVVIFDLFGTIIDYLPEEEYVIASRKIASALSVSVDEFRNAWPKTMKDRDTGRFGSVEADIRNACKILGIHPDDDSITEAVRVRKELYMRNLEPNKSAIGTLTDIKSAGLKLGLISNCGCEIPSLWPETPFADLFDTVIFSCEVGMVKPDLRIYHLCCELLNVIPQRCLYVGDGSERELTGALKVGMDPVLIWVGQDINPNDSRIDALEWQGRIIHDLCEILAIIGIDGCRDDLSR